MLYDLPATIIKWLKDSFPIFPPTLGFDELNKIVPDEWSSDAEALDWVVQGLQHFGVVLVDEVLSFPVREQVAATPVTEITDNKHNSEELALDFKNINKELYNIIVRSPALVFSLYFHIKRKSYSYEFIFRGENSYTCYKKACSLLDTLRSTWGQYVKKSISQERWVEARTEILESLFQLPFNEKWCCHVIQPHIHNAHKWIFNRLEVLKLYGYLNQYNSWQVWLEQTLSGQSLKQWHTYYERLEILARKQKIIRDKLASTFHGLIVSYTERYKSFEVSESDLSQSAWVGLLKGIDSYHSQTVATISTIASSYIQKELRRTIKEQKNMHGMSDNIIKKRSKLRKMEQQVLMIHGRQATNQELSKSLGIPVAEVNDLRKGRPMQRLSSLVPHLEGVSLEDQLLDRRYEPGEYEVNERL